MVSRYIINIQREIEFYNACLLSFNLKWNCIYTVGINNGEKHSSVVQLNLNFTHVCACTFTACKT